MTPLPHAAVRKREPRLANRKLTEGETEVALHYLRHYVREQAAPARAAALALKCSLRTAERLLSATTPFSGRLKRRYVVNMSARTGIPLENILRTCWKEYQEHLGGWLDIQLPSMACRAASELACGLSLRASLGYGVHSDYTVSNGINGRPVALEFRLYNKAGKAHVIEIKESAQCVGLRMLYIAPSGLVLYNGHPKASTVEDIMLIISKENKAIIRNEQKNIASGARRTVTVDTSKKRGGRPARHAEGVAGK